MKRRAKRAFALVGVLAVPLLLLGSSGAGAALPKAPDLSSKAAIVEYLQSIGVDMNLEIRIVHEGGTFNSAHVGLLETGCLNSLSGEYTRAKDKGQRAKSSQ